MCELSLPATHCREFCSYTNLVSCIAPRGYPGDDYEPTQAYYRYVEECEEEAAKLYD